MEEAFVYIWKNLANGKSYIGYHKGTEDDGYISSSSSHLFWSDFNDSTMQWIREIVHRGTCEECLRHEQELLKSIDLREDKWYNNARGATVIFTDEVREKIRNHHLGKSSGMLGKTHSEETRKTLSQKLRGRVLSEEHKAALRKPRKNTEKMKGHKKSPETLAKIKGIPKPKVECPHCKQLVPIHLRNRWHFDNCKVKQ